MLGNIHTYINGLNNRRLQNCIEYYVLYCCLLLFVLKDVSLSALRPLFYYEHYGLIQGQYHYPEYPVGGGRL